MRLLRLLVFALALIGTTASNARAQDPVTSVTVTAGAPLWSANRPDNGQVNQPNNTINLADCLADDVTITFDIDLSSGQSGKVLEAWSGSDCDVQTNRNENINCVKVSTGEAVDRNVVVKVKDVLQPTGNKDLGINSGTDETCMMAGVSSEPTERRIFFLVLDPGSLMTPLGQTEWLFKYDVIAPNPPSNVMAGPGEESIIVTFTPPRDLDVNTFSVYCAEDEGGCSSAVLIPDGTVPEGKATCGSTNAALAKQVEAHGLKNGTSYVTAISAVDNLGNIGKLSALSCATPQEVTGFFEAYRAAGGQGGGGYCSFAPPRRGPLALFGLALVGMALLRRRR